MRVVRYNRDVIGSYRAFRSWEGPVGRHIAGATELVQVDARLTAPKDTGELAAGHVTDFGHHGPRRDLEGRVIAVPEQAIFVIKGTDPHIIRARRAPRLVFFWKKVGRVVAFKSVQHPGQKANNYLLASLKRVMKRYS